MFEHICLVYVEWKIHLSSQKDINANFWHKKRRKSLTGTIIWIKQKFFPTRTMWIVSVRFWVDGESHFVPKSKYEKLFDSTALDLFGNMFFILMQITYDAEKEFVTKSFHKNYLNLLGNEGKSQTTIIGGVFGCLCGIDWGVRAKHKLHNRPCWRERTPTTDNRNTASTSVVCIGRNMRKYFQRGQVQWKWIVSRILILAQNDILHPLHFTNVRGLYVYLEYDSITLVVWSNTEENISWVTDCLSVESKKTENFQERSKNRNKRERETTHGPLLSTLTFSPLFTITYRARWSLIFTSRSRTVTTKPFK